MRVLKQTTNHTKNTVYTSNDSEVCEMCSA